VLRIQPNEGISLSFGAKAPCARLEVKPVTMDFSYREGFGIEPPPAYERLLLDAIRGDPSLFIRHDGILETWRIVQPVLDAWQKHAPGNFPNYPAGSWGPPETDSLLVHNGDSWRRPAS
jgi:glucose-6-phosphate 1-dehydrogenase